MLRDKIKITNRLFSSLLGIWMTFFLSQETIAQLSIPLVSTKVQGVDSSTIHHLSWGISSAVGDVNYGDDRGTIMFSACYSHRISTISEWEIALHYIALQDLRGMDGSVFRDSTTVVQLAWQADGIWNVQPFSEGTLWHNVRFGIGPSFRYLTAMSAQRYVPQGPQPYIVRYKPNGVLDTLASIPLVFREQNLFQGLSVGAVLKVEYLLALSPTIDLIARAQLHSYIPSFIRGTRSTDFGNFGVNLGSAGIFLRVGWQ